MVAQSLLNRGYKVVVVTEQFDSRLPLTEVADNVIIHRIPIAKKEKLKKFWIWSWVIMNRDVFFKARVIHVHDVFFWLLPLRPFLSKRNIFTTFHGYEDYPIKRRWIIMRKIIEKLSYGTICIGDFMKKWYKSSPSYVSYGAVEMAKANVDYTDSSAIFFGRLEQQTGILEYISAYKIIKKKHPRFKLTVIGDGPLREMLPKGVIHMGFEANIEKFIAPHRFIFVSRYLSMFEAIIQKKEVVAVFSDPVKKDYLEMSPFKDYVFITKSPAEIAKYVDMSLKEGQNRKLIEDAYVWARQNTWRKLVNTYLNLWGIAK